MHRLFFALWPDEPIRRALADTAARLRRTHSAGGRAVRTERLHLTLRFLGDTAELSQRRLDELFESAARVRIAPMRFALDRAGHFQRGRVWWVGSSTPIEALAGLHGALAQDGGLVEDHRRFVPHVTIGRDAGVPLSASIEPIVWEARDFVLVDSTAEQGYRVLGRWPLQA